MTELAFDKASLEPGVVQDGYLTPEAILVHNERAQRAAQEEVKRAEEIAICRRLALEGLTKVAERNPSVKAERELKVIDVRHASGHNRTLPTSP